ncbi:cyclic-AMP phosphodiesterase [Hysterangium stoloniferum]|nr:cyclic-AMP phosphodiesterase [Hysterangium stoloniferum]
MQPSFSLFVLGAGGGPLETNLSSYLCKAYESTWEGDVFALEAGSGIGALSRLLHENEALLSYFGFKPSTTPLVAATRIISAVHIYLITHSHLDHIRLVAHCYAVMRKVPNLFNSGLVLSAGSFPGGRRKRIAAVNSVLEDIETVFSGRLWPKLANREENDEDFSYLLTILHHGQYQRLCPNVSVRTMPLTHGKSFTDPTLPYESSAFFIRHDITRRQFLFFGDVEPDSLSIKPQSIAVWREAACLVPDQLDSIFLECSWSMDRDDALLFGHLSPKHVLRELETFADEIMCSKASNEDGLRTPKRQRKSRSGVLHGLTLYIIHCKAGLNDVHDQTQLIARQVKTLVQEQELGIEVVAVVQGMRIGE